MKHNPIYFALALLCSCSGLQEEYQDPEAGKEIKLEVAFADASTKAAYALENNSLKCSWEAGDSISMISLHNGAIASVNVFTTEAGGRTASFSGRYTGTEEELDAREKDFARERKLQEKESKKNETPEKKGK